MIGKRSNVIMPRMLVVADLDSDKDSWVKCEDQQMTLRRRLYWYDLRGLDATTNSTSITISIPLGNVLSPASLAQLMSTGFQNAQSGKGGLS